MASNLPTPMQTMPMQNTIALRGFIENWLLAICRDTHQQDWK